MISPFLGFLLPVFAFGQQASMTAADNRTLTISNKCVYPVWPGILTSNGTGPATSGFELAAATNRSVTVGWDWVGRVWGRTNCTFNSDNSGHCITGDCGNKLECEVSGTPPTTLAEFAISGNGKLTFFDLSLVDGYDLDMAIVPEYQGGRNNSPSCVMTSPEDDWSITHWCPFDLLVFPPARHPRNSLAFWYPNDGLSRPPLSPCLSACAKWNKPQDCCVAKWNDPEKCKPSLYSTKAKKICPDAYSYAYDDKLSTFTVPTGQGFEITFCPGGQSTDIMAARGVTGDAVRVKGSGLGVGLVGVVVALGLIAL